MLMYVNQDDRVILGMCYSRGIPFTDSRNLTESAIFGREVAKQHDVIKTYRAECLQFVLLGK